MNPLDGVRLGMNAVPLLSPLTGVGQYTLQLITALRQLNVHPWLFYGTGWEQEIRTAAPRAVQGVNNVLRRVLPNPYPLTRFIRQMQFSAGVRQRGITLYHEPAFLAYRFRGPTVVTVHDLSWIRHPETHPADRVRSMNRYMPRVIRDAEHIIVVSDFVKQEVMSHYGVTPDRVTTVRHGVAPVFRPVPAPECVPVLRRYGLQHGQYALVVGTLEPRKNLASMMAAWGHLPQRLRQRFPLVVAGLDGWGMDALSPGLRKMADAGEVRLTGYVPYDCLPALYSGARMFAYPSLYEGFGLPPLEAMACGVPALVSCRASLPEVVGDAGLQVEPLDVEAIAASVQALLEDDSLYARLSAAGRARAATFNWTDCAQQTLAVYRKVVA